MRTPVVTKAKATRNTPPYKNLFVAVEGLVEKFQNTKISAESMAKMTATEIKKFKKQYMA